MRAVARIQRPAQTVAVRPPRQWFPARTLHLVDIENLAGAALPSRDQVIEVQGLYVARLGFGADDQVVMAASHLALLNAALGWPQNAGFLEEYLWAKRQLQLDSRAFASLRRDERRAWQRTPGGRAAYIVPALNPDGTANPRWLGSSAWDLDRRVIASPQTERLLDLQKIAALRVRGSRGPLGTLLERYAQEILEIDPPPSSATAAQTAAWRAHVRAHTTALIWQIRERDDPHRQRVARRLARLPGHDQLWGQEWAQRQG